MARRSRSWTELRSAPQPRGSALYGTWLAAVVVALIAFVLWWAAGPPRTKRDIAACRTAYAKARTAADSLVADSMYVLNPLHRRGDLTHYNLRCADFRSQLSR